MRAAITSPAFQPVAQQAAEERRDALRIAAT
jgi:hypothetical protein